MMLKEKNLFSNSSIGLLLETKEIYKMFLKSAHKFNYNSISNDVWAKEMSKV